ncbi:hypothetical protein EVAR_47416_1 [Eumeta japonica]|uniref:Uncharacterized protein n=1 Tax=Eumeta variegata TaxID=151549 RepID=A0A4C1XYP9_EUMVA|nr:hypothetical protein EVAR_47416_1 [Eumeta japonica]
MQWIGELCAICVVFLKDKCRNTDVREQCGLKDVVTRIEKGFPYRAKLMVQRTRSDGTYEVKFGRQRKKCERSDSVRRRRRRPGEIRSQRRDGGDVTKGVAGLNYSCRRAPGAVSDAHTPMRYRNSDTLHGIANVFEYNIARNECKKNKTKSESFLFALGESTMRSASTGKKPVQDEIAADEGPPLSRLL